MRRTVAECSRESGRSVVQHVQIPPGQYRFRFVLEYKSSLTSVVPTPKALHGAFPVAWPVCLLAPQELQKVSVVVLPLKIAPMLMSYGIGRRSTVANVRQFNMSLFNCKKSPKYFDISCRALCNEEVLYGIYRCAPVGISYRHMILAPCTSNVQA